MAADGNFSIQSAWECWRDKGPKVTWSKLIWGPPSITRVCFIAWLATNERLNTGDRLVTTPYCPFCQDPEENHSHLFFWCIFSSRIWGGILAKCKSNWPSLPWLEIVDFAVRSTSGTSLKMVILKLSFLSTVYHIWMERNSRIFNKALKPEEVVTNSIIQMVRGRLLSMENVKISAGDNWLLEEWSLPLKLLQQHHTIAAGRRMSDVRLHTLRGE